MIYNIKNKAYNGIVSRIELDLLFKNKKSPFSSEVNSSKNNLDLSLKTSKGTIDLHNKLGIKSGLRLCYILQIKE